MEAVIKTYIPGLIPIRSNYHVYVADLLIIEIKYVNFS